MHPSNLKTLSEHDIAVEACMHACITSVMHDIAVAACMHAASPASWMTPCHRPSLTWCEAFSVGKAARRVLGRAVDKHRNRVDAQGTGYSLAG